MSRNLVKIIHVIGTLVLIFGILFCQTPAPENDPRVAEIVIFSIALTLLAIAAMRLYQVSRRSDDTAASAALVLAAAEVFVCLIVLSDLVYDDIRMLASH